MRGVDLTAHTDAPRLVPAALPRDDIERILARLDGAHGAFHQVVIDHRNDDRHLLQAVFALFAHGLVVFLLKEAVVVPDLKALVVARAPGGLRLLLGTLFQDFQQGLVFVPRHTGQILDLLGGHEVPLEHIGAIVNIVAAVRVRIDIPRADALRRRRNLFDQRELCHSSIDAAVLELLREGSLQHACADPRTVLDDLPHFASVVTLYLPVINLLGRRVGLLGRSRELLCCNIRHRLGTRLHTRLRLWATHLRSRAVAHARQVGRHTADRAHGHIVQPWLLQQRLACLRILELGEVVQRLAEFGNGRRLDAPVPVIGGQE